MARRVITKKRGIKGGKGRTAGFARVRQKIKTKKKKKKKIKENTKRKKKKKPKKKKKKKKGQTGFPGFWALRGVRRSDGGGLSGGLSFSGGGGGQGGVGEGA